MTGSLPDSDRRSVAVVGAGTMGAGIAYVFAASGWTTFVVEPSAEQEAAFRRTVTEVARNGVERGRLSPDVANALPARVRVLGAVSDLPLGLTLVIESVPERLPLKREVLRDIEARQPGIIASNTSALSIDKLAESLDDGSKFVGLHFFNPVWSLHLVEIVRGAATNPEVVACVQAIVANIGKQSIVVTDTPGFATSRLDLIAALEAIRMVEAGVATAEDIDRAMVTAYRHPVGPLRLTDIVGLDVRLDIARVLCASLGERYAPPQLLIDKVAAGELGRKTGRGFFDWPAESETTGASS